MSSVKQSFSRAYYGVMHRLHSTPAISSSKPVSRKKAHFVSMIKNMKKISL
jgi:hypothetical protein